MGHASVPGRVSIVIPAYNAVGTVGAAIESVLAQTYSDCELIVVDDGSTDRTAAVLGGFGPRIRVVHQRNSGLAAARNAGQRAAAGEFIAWMDADDLMAPERIQLQASVLGANPEIGVVCSDFSAFEDVEHTLHASYMSTYYSAVDRLGGVLALFPETVGTVRWGGRAAAVRAGRIYEALMWGNFVHPPTVMARRSVLSEAGFGDPSLRFSSDYDLILRLARLASFGYLDAPLLRYRISPGQMSHVNSGERMQLETVQILERIERGDPEAAVRLKRVLRLRVAESYFSAAEAVGNEDRGQAIGLMVRGLKTRVLVRPAARALARIMVPAAMVPGIKRLMNAVPFRRASRITNR